MPNEKLDLNLYMDIARKFRGTDASAAIIGLIGEVEHLRRLLTHAGYHVLATSRSNQDGENFSRELMEKITMALGDNWDAQPGPKL